MKFDLLKVMAAKVIEAWEKGVEVSEPRVVELVEDFVVGNTGFPTAFAKVTPEAANTNQMNFVWKVDTEGGVTKLSVYWVERSFQYHRLFTLEVTPATPDQMGEVKFECGDRSGMSVAPWDFSCRLGSFWPEDNADMNWDDETWLKKATEAGELFAKMTNMVTDYL